MNRPYILIAALAPILATAAVPEPVQPPGTTPQEAIDAAREWIHKNHAHILLNQQYVVSDDVLRYQDADFILCPRLADLLRLRVLPGFDDKNIICLENEVDTQEWRHGESMGRTWRKALDLFMPVLNLALGAGGAFGSPVPTATECRPVRNEAVAKVNALEQELAKVREELMIATTRLQALTSVRNPGAEMEAPGPPPPAPGPPPPAILMITDSDYVAIQHDLLERETGNQNPGSIVSIRLEGKKTSGGRIPLSDVQFKYHGRGKWELLHPMTVKFGDTWIELPPGILDGGFPPPPAPPAPKETPKAVLPPKTTAAPKKAPPVKPAPVTPAPSP